MAPTPVLLPGKSHGRRSLVGCSPWGSEESNTTEQLHFHFSLSCIGEGNGNPLQCSCLENPRDGGAWWAAVYGVTQSRTRLKRLSGNSTQAFKYFNNWFSPALAVPLTLLPNHQPWVGKIIHFQEGSNNHVKKGTDLKKFIFSENISYNYKNIAPS